ncbi:alkaline phosphatase family protein, partial [bacterium]|nr:alkaline phosphatase family protein [bacterium]
MITGPDYAGGTIAAVAAELEARLTGHTPGTRLIPDLAAKIPGTPSYVLVLFDGLGDAQLSHPAASDLAAGRVGAVDAPFPTTTTVSLSTVATAMPPAVHGLIGYEMWLPEAADVVRTIHWTTLTGDDATGIDHRVFLPGPNLWERLSAAGVEPITLQPWGFESSQLSRVLYRGCRFEPYGHEREAARIAAELAATPGRLVFLYVPHVDFAAHVSGQRSQQYTDALKTASAIWEDLSRRLEGAAAVAIADHG